MINILYIIDHSRLKLVNLYVYFTFAWKSPAPIFYEKLTITKQTTSVINLLIKSRCFVFAPSCTELIRNVATRRAIMFSRDNCYQ
jgi:hypothetical protein